MQRACDLIPGGMLTVHLSHDSQLRMALSAAINYCKEELKLNVPIICQISCFLGPECKVIAGNIEVRFLAFLHANIISSLKVPNSATVRGNLLVAGEFDLSLGVFPP